MPLPKSSTMMLRHEPTLIATTGYQMTASSPRGTFSKAELTAVVVTQRIRWRRVHLWNAPRVSPMTVTPVRSGSLLRRHIRAGQEWRARRWSRPPVGAALARPRLRPRPEAGQLRREGQGGWLPLRVVTGLAIDGADTVGYGLNECLDPLIWVIFGNLAIIQQATDGSCAERAQPHGPVPDLGGQPGHDHSALTSFMVRGSISAR